ncbi:hypothetical protein [Shinella pollutisoli]|uniref:Uncharacterized protein n=1 Tax=Shinella pollutisoli TaxID=2250594 RepID=A0ABV7DMF3_9HYPH|nr:hypothetical protein [Shinella pollutisoli]
MVERLVHHIYKPGFERNRIVSVGEDTPSHREFHQRTNPAGTPHANASVLGKALGSGLPKQIVSVFKTTINITRCLHAVPANPSTHLFGGQHVVGAPVISANAGSRPVSQSDRMNQLQMMQYWREKPACATRNGLNPSLLFQNYEDGAACSFA